MNITACTRCEAVLESDMRFCEQCGMSVPTASEPSVPILSTSGPQAALPQEGRPHENSEPGPNHARRIGVMTAVLLCLASLGFGGWWLGMHRPVAAVPKEAKVGTNAATRSTIPQSKPKTAEPEKEAQIEEGGAPNSTRNDEAKAPVMKASQAPMVAGAAVPNVPAKPQPLIDSVATPEPERQANEASAVAPVSAQPPANQQATMAPDESVLAKPEVKPANPANPTLAEVAPRPAAAPEHAYTGPLIGSFSYSGPPVIQNGEVVFEGLPPTSLQLRYDANAWDARVERGEGGRQRIVMRSNKPGTQKKCVVSWNATR